MARLRAERITDLVTEEGELVRVTQQRHPARTYGKGPFMIVWTSGMKERAKQIKHGMTWRVLTWLGEELNFTDFRRVRTVAIAAELDSNSGSISRAMTELEALNILERDGRGAQSLWRFTQDFGWQGDVDSFRAFGAGRLKGKKPPHVRSVSTLPPHNAYYGNRAAAPGSNSGQCAAGAPSILVIST